MTALHELESGEGPCRPCNIQVTWAMCMSLNSLTTLQRTHDCSQTTSDRDHRAHLCKGGHILKLKVHDAVSLQGEVLPFCLFRHCHVHGGVDLRRTTGM